MAVATMTSIVALLKEVYSVRLTSQLNNEIVTTKRLERTSKGVVETVGGKYVDFPIRTKRNSGIGNRLENEALPTAGSQGYEEVHVPLTHAYGRFRVTGQMMELADKDYQAFASGFDEEMNGLKDDVKKDYERQIYGNGTGLMATVTADGANTVTVNSTQYLEIGQVIDIRTIATGASVAANREITDINGLVVTYNGADVAATVAEGIYREGNFTGGTSRELSGFGLIFSATSTLHGLAPASVRKWAAIVDSNAGVNRPLSEGLMIAMCDAVRTAGGGSTTAIFGGLGVRRAYFNLLTQQRRYTDTKDFEGGFKGLSFMYGENDIPMMAIVDAPGNRMFFADETKLKIFRNKEWHFGDSDGNILKWVTGFDAWEGFLKLYSELGTTQRNAQGLLSDLTEG